MPITYPTEVPDLEPVQLGRDELYEIGRVVRACAEIEEMVNMILAKLLGAPHKHITVLVGKSNLRTRLGFVKYYCEMHGGEWNDHYKDSFNNAFDEIIAHRNELVHGFYLGKAGTFWTFLTMTTDPALNGNPLHRAVCVETKDMSATADAAERCVRTIEENFGLRASREKLREQPLIPHRKSRSGKQATGQRPQPEA